MSVEVEKIDLGWPWRAGFNSSNAVRVGNLLFTGGQVALDPQGNVVGKGDIRAQARQVFENLKAILERVGATFDDVIKLNYYFTDIGTLKEFWEVRSEYVRTDLPCGTGVEVRRLAFDDLMVEVEAIAVVRGK